MQKSHPSSSHNHHANQPRPHAKPHSAAPHAAKPAHAASKPHASAHKPTHSPAHRTAHVTPADHSARPAPRDFANFAEPVAAENPPIRRIDLANSVELKPAAHASDSSAAPGIRFDDLGLLPSILKSLHGQGYVTPTPIQAQSIPIVLAGRDMFGCAQTGTGKTAAFALPIIHRLCQPGAGKRVPGGVRCLVLAPTRELAEQIAESFATYGGHTNLHVSVIFGGVGYAPQIRALRSGLDVLVATPGRLQDLIQQGHARLGDVQTFVLDEADRMLDMGFIQPIRQIASLLPQTRQTLLFSATMPREILRLAESLLRDPAKVSVTPTSSAAPKIEQLLYHVPRTRKQALLEHVLEEHDTPRVVVFTRTKHGADKVCKRLERVGVEAGSIHGNKGQNQRRRALEAFRSGRMRVLVATDVAARGLDVDEISHVINYDLPMEPEAYVHRIGRTGRAGASGIAMSFCDHEERSLLRQIERLTSKPIPVAKLPDGLKDIARDEAREADMEAATRTAADPRNRAGTGVRQRPGPYDASFTAPASEPQGMLAVAPGWNGTRGSTKPAGHARPAAPHSNRTAHHGSAPAHGSHANGKKPFRGVTQRGGQNPRQGR